MNNILIEKNIFGVSSNGEEKNISIKIGAPRQTDEDDYSCTLKISGLYHNLPEVIGFDPWQAVTLSLGFVHQNLSLFIKEGGKLYWEKGGNEVTMEEIFGNGLLHGE